MAVTEGYSTMEEHLGEAVKEVLLNTLGADLEEAMEKNPEEAWRRT